MINDGEEGDKKAEFEGKGPLSSDLYHTFWVSWDDFGVDVGTGSLVGQNKFMGYKGDENRPVNMISVKTGSGSEGDWCFSN